ncbi:hypothetical protein QFC24_004165 [Naganishia onofrii]|uniref:Uncharacterized protein n=1 Tax=Naganishia onofrii TaxID=1851511 RepID=A0ACC2XGH0_9TREE|nr:hypothetical protein QFC24_004165 [Naganishia onofrii]
MKASLCSLELEHKGTITWLSEHFSNRLTTFPAQADKCSLDLLLPAMTLNQVSKKPDVEAPSAVQTPQVAAGNGNKNPTLPVKIAAPAPEIEEQPVVRRPSPQRSCSSTPTASHNLDDLSKRSLPSSRWSFFTKPYSSEPFDPTQASKTFDEAEWFGVPR